MRIELENTFHNTRTSLYAREKTISHRAYVAALRRLCGVEGCCCGGHVHVVTEGIGIAPTSVGGPYEVVEV